ncbi:hypothetical protein C8J56DRAFT_1042677 [Mycena floridula]|nr:hypothetical protein C8J56DRAFT_1042677 [Mycena floridula]
MAKATTAKEREIEKTDDRMSKCLLLIPNVIWSRKRKERKDVRKGEQGIDVDMADAIPALIIMPLSGPSPVVQGAAIDKPGQDAAPLCKPIQTPSPLSNLPSLSTSCLTEPSQKAKLIQQRHLIPTVPV